ncbi:hypothetical protein BDQ12DRAFT_725082 [Crucibulum laeve]|uniref:Uncharacterized protein n=1 Tax=Crucibulum laeve TaxID=68775 RepID=A0A5C3M683_9AGAR|nr:hypothetical protein BDQ12DRAFT_725082 [Crucibulum laeve]
MCHSTHSTDATFDLAAPAAEQPAFTSRKRAISSVDTSPKKQSKKAKPALNLELTGGAIGGKGGKSQGAKGKARGRAIKKTSAMKDAEVAAAEAEGDPDHLTHVEQVLTDSGASVAPPSSHRLRQSEIIMPTEIQNKEKDKLDEKIEEEKEDDQRSEESEDKGTEEEEDTVVTTPIRSSSGSSEKSTDEYDTPEDTEDADILMKTPSKKIQVQVQTKKRFFKEHLELKVVFCMEKAMGNAANMADFADTQDIEDVDQVLASEFGKIKLYISVQDPQTLDISEMKRLAAEVPLSTKIKPVLEILGMRYQPIKGK